MLLMAGSVRVAEVEVEVEVYHGFAISLTEVRISKVLIAAKPQIAGYQQGGPLGIISFLHKAATARGVTVADTFVHH